MSAAERRPALRTAAADAEPPQQGTRTLKRQRRAQQDDGASGDGAVEGEAARAVDWSFLSGSNETEAGGFAVVHVGANDSSEWEDVFPNGTTVKVVYVSGSGSTDSIVLVPDDDNDESASESASASEEYSASGSLDATVSPALALPTEPPSHSGSKAVGATSGGKIGDAVTYSVVFAAVAVVVVVAGVYFARRYTAKRARDNDHGRVRSYDLSAMFQAARQPTSSPSILGDAARSYRPQQSTGTQSSPMRATTILADTETLAPIRQTVVLTPLRRPNRLERVTLDVHRLRASTAPVVLYEPSL